MPWKSIGFAGGARWSTMRGAVESLEVPALVYSEELGRIYANQAGHEAGLLRSLIGVMGLVEVGAPGVRELAVAEDLAGRSARGRPGLRARWPRRVQIRTGDGPRSVLITALLESSGKRIGWLATMLGPVGQTCRDAPVFAAEVG
jgi:hypothetical protein